ncbi:hypothetical protein N2152v2_002223 [Parachlorella kessleri]
MAQVVSLVPEYHTYWNQQDKPFLTASLASGAYGTILQVVNSIGNPSLIEVLSNIDQALGVTARDLENLSLLWVHRARTCFQQECWTLGVQYLSFACNYAAAVDASPAMEDPYPSYQPTSPNYEPNSPRYQPTPPSQPSSPGYSPTFPNFEPSRMIPTPHAVHYGPDPRVSPPSPPDLIAAGQKYYSKLFTAAAEQASPPTTDTDAGEALLDLNKGGPSSPASSDSSAEQMAGAVATIMSASRTARPGRAKAGRILDYHSIARLVLVISPSPHTYSELWEEAVRLKLLPAEPRQLGQDGLKRAISRDLVRRQPRGIFTLDDTAHVGLKGWGPSGSDGKRRMDKTAVAWARPGGSKRIRRTYEDPAWYPGSKAAAEIP